MRALARQRVGRVENAQLEQLPCVVPFVQCVADVEAFVALKADQIGTERGSHRPGERGLADAGLALEEQRPFEPKRQKQRNRQTAIRDVMLIG